MGVRGIRQGKVALTVLAMVSVLLSASKAEGPKSGSLSAKSSNDSRIVVIKREFGLYLYDGRSLIKRFPVAIGKHAGDKLKAGDMKTPEGRFYIERIHDSRSWVHDFRDGKGPINGAYGPLFLRLYTGADRTKSGKAWKGIAIHGTHDPASIGKMATEGCIRMHNKDIEELKQSVRIGTSVLIE